MAADGTTFPPFQTIPDLTPATGLNFTDKVWINQQGLDRSAQLGDIANLVLPLTVTAFNGRTGPVQLTLLDITQAGGAPLTSPFFDGVPQAPTPPNGADDARIATTAFVQDAIRGAVAGVSSFNGREGDVVLTSADITGAGGALASQLAGYLPLAGGTLTGPGNLTVNGQATFNTPISVNGGAVVATTYGTGNYYYSQSSAGTQAAPAPITGSWFIGGLIWEGYDGSAFGAASAVYASASQPWTPTAHGSNLILYTTPNNSTGSRTAAILDQAGNFSVIGNLSANGTVTAAGGTFTGPTTVNGTLSASSATLPLSLTNTGAGNGPQIQAYEPGLPVGGSTGFYTGVANSTSNQAYMGFINVAGAGSNTNQAFLGVAGAASFLTVDGLGNARTNDFIIAASKPVNTVYAAPAAAAGAPSWRTLVGADLPNPAAAAKGGVMSFVPVANQFLTGIATTGGPTAAQPSTVNLSDRDAVATSFTPTVQVNAGNTGIGDGVFSGVSGTASYRRLGFLVIFYLNVHFTLTYTTASGALLIGGFPLAGAQITSSVHFMVTPWPGSPADHLLGQMGANGLVGMITGNNYVANNWGPSSGAIWGLVSGTAYNVYAGGVYSTT